jgi:hypothetical protein
MDAYPDDPYILYEEKSNPIFQVKHHCTIFSQPESESPLSSIDVEAQNDNSAVNVNIEK